MKLECTDDIVTTNYIKTCLLLTRVFPKFCQFFQILHYFFQITILLNNQLILKNKSYLSWSKYLINDKMSFKNQNTLFGRFEQLKK